MQLKILIISSLQETTPPLGYGGTERFVHYLAEDLTSKGHNITVACRNGSIWGSYRKLELDTINPDVEFLLRDIEINDYDLIHLNTKIPSITNALSKLRIPVVVTFHNNFRKTSGWISTIKENYSNFYFTVISNSLKTRVIEALKLNNVNYPEHSIKDLSFGMDVFSYVEKYNSKVKRDYHLYIGVIARYKGVLDIVKTFIGSNEKLILVGPYNGDENKEYFDEVMQVVNDNENISYFGETKNEDEKIELINGAKSLLVATGVISDFITKHGIETFTKQLPLELKDKGIRVNALRPGFVYTESVKKFFPDVEPNEALDPKAVANKVIEIALNEQLNGQIMELKK